MLFVLLCCSCSCVVVCCVAACCCVVLVAVCCYVVFLVWCFAAPSCVLLCVDVSDVCGFVVLL